MITRQFERAFFSLHEGQGTNNEDSEFDSEGLRYSTFSFLSLLSSQMIVQHFIEGLSNFGKCLRLSNSKPKILMYAKMWKLQRVIECCCEMIENMINYKEPT